MIRIRSAEPLNHFRVRLEFTDGTEREVDFEPYLHGPIFEPLRQDPALFRTIRVDPELGTVVWSNGADMDPDVLRGTHPPAEQNASARAAVRESSSEPFSRSE